jgi:hypothetical protein
VVGGERRKRMKIWFYFTCKTAGPTLMAVMVFLDNDVQMLLLSMDGILTEFWM